MFIEEAGASSVHNFIDGTLLNSFGVTSIDVSFQHDDKNGDDCHDRHESVEDFTRVFHRFKRDSWINRDIRPVHNDVNQHKDEDKCGLAVVVFSRLLNFKTREQGVEVRVILEESFFWNILAFNNVVLFFKIIVEINHRNFKMMLIWNQFQWSKSPAQLTSYPAHSHRLSLPEVNPGK